MKRISCFGKQFAATVLGLAFLAVTALPALAASPSAFTVKAELPSNQMDTGNTYFDLLVEPDQRQTLNLAITNSEAEDVVAHIALNPASNAQNGLIIYSDPNARDESLALSITDIAQVEEERILIPAGTTQTASILLQTPTEPFTGTILGGISVTTDFARQEDQEDTAAQNGIIIENRYAYVIGLKLQTDPEPVEPEFHLKAIEPGLVNHRQALLINLQQSEPVVAGGLDVTAKVTRSDDADFEKDLNLTNVQMAPSSNGDFVIGWNEPIAPGTYRLQMRVDWRERHWEWDEEFTISSGEAQNTNDESVMNYDTGSGVPVWAIVLIICLLVLILLALLLLLSRRKRDKKEA